MDTAIVKIYVSILHVIRKYTRFANFTRLAYIFQILQYFATKLSSFTNFRMLLNAVVMNFATLFLKLFCLLCIWSIRTS